MMTLEKFEEASELVKRVTNPTKLVYSDYLSEATGAKVYLKPENMQHTGAYKIRGAYYKISTLSEEERSRGLITASAGKPCPGRGLRGEEVRVPGCDRHAHRDPAHQGEPHEELRRGSDPVRGRLR